MPEAGSRPALRAAALVAVVLAAGWNAWYHWMRDEPDPVAETLADPGYGAVRLVLSAEGRATCTATLAGTPLPAASDGPSAPIPVILRRPTAGAAPKKGDPPWITLAEPGGRTSGGVRIVDVGFRPLRPVSDTTWLGEISFTLGAPPGHAGSVSDTARLVLHAEEGPDGPVVESCYGVHRAVEGCGALGGRVVADVTEGGPAIERCTFTEGDTGTYTALDELLERGRR